MHTLRSPRQKVLTSTPQVTVNAPKRTKRGQNAIKRAAIMAISVLVASIAVAVSFSAADPAPAQARGGGYVDKCGEGRIFLDAKEKETFLLHNKVRRNHNLRPLCVHPRLQKAARAHSRDMIRRDYFSHDTKGRNEGACERIHRYGYRYRKCAENIAWGSGSSGSPRNMMRIWMRSDGHRRNILDKDFRQIGVGVHIGTWQGRRNTSMYTADFGVPRR